MEKLMEKSEEQELPIVQDGIWSSRPPDSSTKPNIRRPRKRMCSTG